MSYMSGKSPFGETTGYPVGALIASFTMIQYDTIRDAILTCARKPTSVSLIYRTEPTIKKCKTQKLKIDRHNRATV